MDEDLEHILAFAKEHRWSDLGIYLVVLCRFVSNLPKAKYDWDECFSGAYDQFQEQITLCEEFQDDLFRIAATHINGGANSVDFKRFVWVSWEPFNKRADCVYGKNMKKHRYRLRCKALEGVPMEKHPEVLDEMSELHNFLIVLFSQVTTDEKTEELYTASVKVLTHWIASSNHFATYLTPKYFGQLEK